MTAKEGVVSRSDTERSESGWESPRLVPLGQVEPVAPDETAGQWLEAYRYWRGK